VAQRVGMDYVGPFTYNGVRFALGCLTRAAVAAGRGRPVHPAPRTGRLFILGGGALGAHFLSRPRCSRWRCYTTAGKAGFITGLYVVIVPILGLSGTSALRGNVGRRCAGCRRALPAIGDRKLPDGVEICWFWSAPFSGASRCSRWPGCPHGPGRGTGLYQFSVCSLLSLITAVLFRGGCLGFHICGVRANFIWWRPVGRGGSIPAGRGPAQRPSSPRVDPDEPEAVFAALGGWMLLGETLSLRGGAAGSCWRGCWWSQLWTLKK
jgi:hypothetical protein